MGNVIRLPDKDDRLWAEIEAGIDQRFEGLDAESIKSYKELLQPVFLSMVRWRMDVTHSLNDVPTEHHEILREWFTQAVLKFINSLGLELVNIIIDLKLENIQLQKALTNS